MCTRNTRQSWLWMNTDSGLQFGVYRYVHVHSHRQCPGMYVICDTCRKVCCGSTKDVPSLAVNDCWSHIPCCVRLVDTLSRNMTVSAFVINAFVASCGFVEKAQVFFIIFFSSRVSVSGLLVKPQSCEICWLSVELFQGKLLWTCRKWSASITWCLWPWSRHGTKILRQCQA